MKLFKPALAFILLGCHVYTGCSDDEVDPARPRTDGGADATTPKDGGTSTSDGSTGTDSASTPDTSSPTDSAPPKDSAPQDTGNDVADVTTDSGDAALDASKTAQCTTYCACMSTSCANELPSNCQATCEAQTTWQLDCRITHCGYATVGDDAGKAMHCPHAAGVNTCL